MIMPKPPTAYTTYTVVFTDAEEESNDILVSLKE